MNLNLLLESATFVINSEDLYYIESRIEELDNVREQAELNGDRLFKHISIYEVPFINGIMLCDWLYDSSNPETETIRRVLMKLIDQNTTIDDDQYHIRVREINNYECDQPWALACLIRNEFLELHIRNFRDLISAYRYYLKNVNSEREYYEFASRCFPNLVFHSNIPHSLKTLSAPLNEYINIIKHLSAINDSFMQIFMDNKTQGLPKVLEIFSSINQLACSLEGNPESARERLSFTFTGDDGQDITVICSPHTKLEYTGKPGDQEYRYDRIYFHQGLEDIAGGGKILIGYIGYHL